MKKLLLALIFIQTIIFAQFKTIQRIYFDNYTSNFERSFVFQKSDTLLFFFKFQNTGSIFVYESLDYGEEWTYKNEITGFSVPETDPLGYDIVQLNENEYMIAQLQFSGRLLVFKYNCNDNSLEQYGTGGVSESSTSKVELEVIDSNTFIASLWDSQNNIFTLLTTDKGQTWSSKQSFSEINTNDIPLEITYHKNSLYSVFGEGNSIKMIKSQDLGTTWSSAATIFINDKPVFHPEIYSDGNTLYTVFEEQFYDNIVDDSTNNICYLSSINDGATWSSKKNYTNFIGDDFISEVNYTGGRLIITSLSNRETASKLETYFGDLTYTTDTAPPIVYWTDIPNSIEYEEDFPIRIFINDETGFNSVTSYFNNYTYTLFDDGNHNDSLAGDNIYGNILSGLNPDTPLGPKEARTVAINNITLPINNRGILADVNNSESVRLSINIIDTDANSKEVIKDIRIAGLSSGSLGRYNGKGFLFSGGFFLSGYANSELWANAVASASLNEDYLPGKVGSSPDDPTNLVYSVKPSETPFGSSWQDWKSAVNNGAYFYDGDNDGVYNPVDKNSNGQWDPDEDKPDFLFDGTFYTVYNDAQPSSERRWGGSPLGIEIRQTIFASERNTLLNNVVFVRYSLLYKGLGNPSEPDSLTNVIFSIWTDTDIGATASSASDDRVGCDTTLQSGYMYNDGDDPDWGSNVPAIFKTIVQGPLIKTNNQNDIGFNRMGPDLGAEEYPGFRNSGMGSYTNFIGGDPYLRDPDSQEAARNSMVGKAADGTYPDPCDFAYGEVHNMNCFYINRFFWFSGDPVADIGWICTAAEDQRDVVNTEEFTLVKNHPTDIIVAYVVGQGTDPINSITVAREITQNVHKEYQRNFSTLVGVDDKKENVVNSFSLSQNYPNPFNPTSKIKYQIAKLGKVELIVYDILGREVATLINEVKSPGSYEVTFDASQLASGVYFYRLTSGDYVQTKKMMLIK